MAVQERVEPQSVGVEIGTVFYRSWGYDQTNVDFYKVTKVTATGVWLRDIGSKHTPNGVVADVDSVDMNSPKHFHRLQAYGPAESRTVYCAFNSYSSLSMWDGQPKYQTGHGAGH